MGYEEWLESPVIEGHKKYLLCESNEIFKNWQEAHIDFDSHRQEDVILKNGEITIKYFYPDEEDKFELFETLECGKIVFEADTFDEAVNEMLKRYHREMEELRKKAIDRR